MNKVTIGQYLPFDSVVHRLDPRVKLVGVFVFIITVFFVDSFLGYIPLVALVALTIFLAKIPIRSVLRSIRPILFLIIVTGIINLLTTPGRPIVTLGPVSITYEALYKTAFAIFRLILLIIATTILTYTTSPMELTHGLEKLFSPFKRIGFPAAEIAMMISISLRFIPTLFDEAQKIKMAQMARGADFESGNIIQRSMAMVPLLVPLFINAFKRSDDLAVAMEARLYRIGEERTKLNEIHMTSRDKLVLLAVLILCGIIIAVHFI